MIKKILVILLAIMSVAGIAFSVLNFLTVESEAIDQSVSWETLYIYKQADKTYYFCNGEPADCCTVTAQPKD